MTQHFIGKVFQGQGFTIKVVNLTRIEVTFRLEEYNGPVNVGTVNMDLFNQMLRLFGVQDTLPQEVQDLINTLPRMDDWEEYNGELNPDPDDLPNMQRLADLLMTPVERTIFAENGLTVADLYDYDNEVPDQIHTITDRWNRVCGETLF